MQGIGDRSGSDMGICLPHKVYLGSANKGVLFNFFPLFYFRFTIRSCVIIDLQNIAK